MIETPKPASNLEDFNAQARSFIAKVKAHNASAPEDKRISQTGMANTIRFMYGAFVEDQKNQITPYQQAVLDMNKSGKWELLDTNSDGIVDTEYNATTGVSRPYKAAGTDPSLIELDTGTDGAGTYGPPSQANAAANPGAYGMQPSAEAMQAAIEAAGQSDQFGVLGVDDRYDVLQKAPDYGVDAAETQRLYQEQQGKKEAEGKQSYEDLVRKKIREEVGIVPYGLGEISRIDTSIKKSLGDAERNVIAAAPGAAKSAWQFLFGK